MNKISVKKISVNKISVKRPLKLLLELAQTNQSLCIEMERQCKEIEDELLKTTNELQASIAEIEMLTEQQMRLHKENRYY